MARVSNWFKATSVSAEIVYIYLPQWLPLNVKSVVSQLGKETRSIVM